VLATACKAIADMDLTRVNRIAATLLRNVERDIGRTLRHEADRHQRRTTDDPDDLRANFGIEGPFESVAYLALEVESLVGHARGAGCPFHDLDAKAIAEGSAAFTTIKEWFDA
jgi:RNA polymerase sigma-70 factor (ECF subfamily)